MRHEHQFQQVDRCAQPDTLLYKFVFRCGNCPALFLIELPELEEWPRENDRPMPLAVPHTVIEKAIAGR